MSKLLKSIISLVLCSVLVFATVSVSFAADNNSEGVPLVYVCGQGFPLVVDEADGSKRTIYPVQLPDGFVEETVKANLGIFAKAVITQQWDEFCDVFYEIFSELYSELKLDAKGKPINNSRADWNWRTRGNIDCESLTGSHNSIKYNYYYDWRLDPYVIAEDLHDYIEFIMDATGVDSVALSGRCLGACITSAYMEKYDGEYISDYIVYASALNGATICSKAFCGELYIDPNGAERYLYDLDITADQNINELIKAFATLYNDTYGLDVACWSVNNVYNKVCMNIIPRLLVDTFGTFPGYWSMVSSEDYEKAKETVFYGADMNIYSDFIKIIDDYHYNVQCKANDDFKSYVNNGIEVSNVVKYGYQSMPVTTDTDLLSDSICDVKSASMGATAALVGEELNTSYISQATELGKDKFISPDNQIDASTCLFPERTWFIKNLEHKNFPNIIDSLFDEIINNDGYNVFTDEEFPQYLVYSDTESGEKFGPMVDENKDTDQKYKVSFFKATWNFIKSLFNLIKTELIKLFNKQ